MHCSINETELIGTIKETLFPENYVGKDYLEEGSWILFALSEDHIIIEEEQLLYDFNSFLGEVGGSLGLFLGISLLSMYEWGLTIMRRLWNLCRKLIKESTAHREDSNSNQCRDQLPPCLSHPAKCC